MTTEDRRFLRAMKIADDGKWPEDREDLLCSQQEAQRIMAAARWAMEHPIPPARRSGPSWWRLPAILILSGVGALLIDWMVRQ